MNAHTLPEVTTDSGFRYIVELPRALGAESAKDAEARARAVLATRLASHYDADSVRARIVWHEPDRTEVYFTCVDECQTCEDEYAYEMEGLA